MFLLAAQELSLAAVVQLQPNSAAVLFLMTAVSALVPVFLLFLVYERFPEVIGSRSCSKIIKTLKRRVLGNPFLL